MSSDTTSTPAMTPGLTFLMAASCGLVAANLYFGQPLAGPIAADIGLPDKAAGLIVTLTQIGYVLGLLFIVPLGDLLENRRLIVTLVAMVIVALVVAGLSQTPHLFLGAAFAVGIASTSVQLIVPFAAGLASDAKRGQVVGNVMSGLMVGIMMARPVASFITRVSSWHVVYFLSAAIMLVLAFVLHARLPLRRPQSRESYGQLIGSMLMLFKSEPVVRRRALYQACQFSAFTVFWTVVPLVLAGPAFGVGQGAIGLFALAGVAGAIASPIAGRLADRDLGGPATVFGMMAVASGFLMSWLGESGGALQLSLLTIGAIVLDFGVTTTMVVGQRAIFGLDPARRARMNGIYMATFFIGGAIGSSLGVWLYEAHGWQGAATLGVALPCMAILYFLTDRRR
ncbi:MFS transporter [Roseibium sp.]|uniref:MFS transporter n=1 Tax=Roseibium sp. TaxID=1936156 RepID=UPI003A981E7F